MHTVVDGADIGGLPSALMGPLTARDGEGERPGAEAPGSSPRCDPGAEAPGKLHSVRSWGRRPWKAPLSREGELHLGPKPPVSSPGKDPGAKAPGSFPSPERGSLMTSTINY